VKRLLIVIAVLTSTSTAFAVTPSVFCRANNEPGTKWYYSSIFPQAAGKTAHDYADDWEAWLKAQVANGSLNDKYKITLAQCHVEPGGEFLARSQRDHDMAEHQNPGAMSAAINLAWDPRPNYMWCLSQPAVLDKKLIDTPQYTPVFEYDGKNDKSYYQAAFMNYLKNKLGYNSLAVCHTYRDTTLAETERKRAFGTDEENNRTPKEIRWPEK
jgi:hypothetical protein